MYSKDLVRRMTESGIVDAVGFNCVSAPGAMRTLVQQLGSTALPLSVMPNAGYPVVTRTQVKYQGKPEYFAKELARIAVEGVRSWEVAAAPLRLTLPPCGQRWILCLLWKKRPRRCRFPPRKHRRWKKMTRSCAS